MKFLLKRLYKFFFLFFERFLKIHITLSSYYSPIPNLFELNHNIFNKKYSLSNINYDHKKSKNLITKLLKFKEEYYPIKNLGLSQVDAFILYSFIRYQKPKNIVEIGSGESTKIIYNALKKNNNFKEFYSIDPYPERISKILNKINDKKFFKIKKKVQNLEKSFFFNANLVFIDSSHVAKIGSDVLYEIFEILPNLKSGSLIHFHDIWIPGNYPKDIIETGYQFWNESYFLQAFLLHNKKYEVLYLGNYLKIKDNYFLKKKFKYYKKDHRLTSMWLIKK
jgi:predicted O-methyltransferase YrrM